MLLFLLITKIQTNNGLKFLREIEVITLGIKKRFKSSVLNVSDDVFKTKLSEFLAENAGKLEVLSGAASKQLVIAGKAVTTSSSKVSTILGRFTPDIEDLFNELGSFKNVGLGEVKGGINILNKPDYYTKLADWWEAFNKPWLTKAIERGDDIYLATIPRKVEDLIDGAGNLKGAYARELDLLTTKGYKPINITDGEWGNILIWLKKAYVKDGARLEIATVENAFKTHINVVEGIDRVSGVNGGHNLIEFKKAISPGPQQRVVIISETPMPGVYGITTFEYKLFAIDPKLNILPTYIQKDGIDVIYTKTTFDPAIFSGDMMIDLGTKAFKDAMDKNGFDIIKRKFTGVANGRTINGYFEMNSQGERIIKTWWISN